jgi:hypothetical protein
MNGKRSVIVHALRVSMSWSVTVNGSDVGERGGLLGLWRTRSGLWRRSRQLAVTTSGCGYFRAARAAASAAVSTVTLTSFDM